MMTEGIAMVIRAERQVDHDAVREDAPVVSGVVTYAEEFGEGAAS